MTDGELALSIVAGAAVIGLIANVIIANWPRRKP